MQTCRVFAQTVTYGICVVLSHRLADGTEKSVGFASRTLSTAEKKYSQIEKEGLACVLELIALGHICMDIFFTDNGP